MNRRDRRRNRLPARTRPGAPVRQPSGIPVRTASRGRLLLGTALASTLLVGTLSAPTTAQAQVTCPAGTFPPPGPITISNPGDAIDCVNVVDRNNDVLEDVIALETGGAGEFVVLNNSGDLTAQNAVAAAAARGIVVNTVGGAGSFIDITNTGDVSAVANGDAVGIFAVASGDESPISIVNSGNMQIFADEGDAFGFFGRTESADSPLLITNSGDLFAQSTNDDAIGIVAQTSGTRSEGIVINHGNAIAIADAIAIGIDAFANGDDNPLLIENSGDLVQVGEDSYGIIASTGGFDSPLLIKNSGDMVSIANNDAVGIDATTIAINSSIEVHNSGDFRVTADADTGNNARGIEVETSGENAPAKVDNSGDIEAFGVEQVTGIKVRTFGPGSLIDIHNSGALKVETSEMGSTEEAQGIDAETTSENSRIDIDNSGDIEVVTRGEGDPGEADGISAYTELANSKVEIRNRGDIDLMTLGDETSADGIDINTNGFNSDIEVWNSGHMTVTANGGSADGIEADSDGESSDLTIHNSGDLRIEAKGEEDSADGIDGDTDGPNSLLKIVNSGALWVKTTGTNSADGIDASTDGDNSGVEIHNSGDMTIIALDGTTNSSAGIEVDTGGYGPYGPYGPSYGDGSGVKVVNSGNIDVTTSGDGGKAEGIGVETEGDDAKIEVHNSGDLHAEAKGASLAAGINADSYGVGSPIDIENSGSVYAKGGYRNVGIRAFSTYANKTTITNTGTVGAESHRAIDVKGAGTAHIDNAGTVTGFVDLTDQDDVFNNQSGGVFETKLTSFFGAGDDLFTNRSGGTVQAATDGSKSETSFFEGLETFKNAGLISMVDAKEGDSFTISNTPGGTDLDYKGGGTLGVDSFLGGLGSKSDTFTIEGNVSGKTKVAVYNTNPGGGAFNAEGIPVVFATGETPDANAFRLQDGPIDAGFFDYDLFFEGGGSGQWELRSFAGGGAHLLPQLLTAAQDLWHQSSATWFDRTADLRVLMHGGPAPLADGSKSLGVAPVQEQLAPAVWLKGGGSWLDRDATASTSAYGRNYKFNLDRELETVDIQVGIDMGTRDVLGAGDALVFGVLGGFVHGDLDYDSLARRFTYSGGQVGAYATYLSGGLFVDTLLNAHITELDTNTRGFPGSVDANTIGLRTDAGYRFGSFSGGAFIEPLGTIEVMWADIDGFSQDGNRVSFDDDANVRGRLGLRAGTTSEVWEGTLMEPFIVGSLWSHLSGDNQATLVSSGRTFQFQDNLEDVWGEVSAGVNFFNFSQTTSVFGKVDVTFGDDVSGVGGKAGMRVAW